MDFLNQEKIFLSLCCPHDRDVLTGKKKLSLWDFERLTYLIMEFGFTDYAIHLHTVHDDLMYHLSKQNDRELEIIKEYSSYIEDEELVKYKKWISDFLETVPPKKLDYCRRKLLDL